MKKTLIKIAGICLISTIVFASCKKSDSQDSPAPSGGGSSTPKTTYASPMGTSPGTLKAGPYAGTDSIATLPFGIMNKFIFGGVFSPDSDVPGVAVKGDSTYELLSYKGESMRLIYTVSKGYWGCAFLVRDNGWTDSIYITPAVSKITLKVRYSHNCNITMFPFGVSTYGKTELYQTSNAAIANPVYETVTIPLSGKPTGTKGFSIPFSLGIDFGSGTDNTMVRPAAGTKVIIDIKDIQFE
ncbi:MAG: hypothetical protein H7259_08040 [Cytophagales bacterium]|nr:hypothetical protein [Cytophaga sp.]